MTYPFDLAEMLSWAHDLYKLGFKRPGTRQGHRAEAYLEKCLRSLGIAKVFAEEVKIHGWFQQDVYLSASGNSGSISLPAEPIVYTRFTAPGGIKAPVVDLGHGTEAEFKNRDIRGKIALARYAHGYLPYDTLKAWAYFLHDPEDSLAGRGQLMTWITEEERRVYQAAVDAGAVGFIGIYPLDLTPYLCFEGGDAFTGKLGPIPGVGLRKSDGAGLLDLMNKGSVDATVILTGESKPAVARNIVGLIPGKSQRVIQVTCHHDSMWLGATEDAAGVAVVLALAKAFAGRTPEKTLAFVLEAAECLYVSGSKGYISRHAADLINDLIVDLHIEHLALEYIETPDGAIAPTGNIQPRGFFVSDQGPMVDIVKQAIVSQNLRRTALLPTDTPLEVPTDAAAYARGGLPIASFISAPLYWNALEDTWEKIAVDELIPTARAYFDIIAHLMETDPDLIRRPALPLNGYRLKIHERPKAR